MSRQIGLAGMHWTFLKESFPRATVRSGYEPRRLSKAKPQSLPDIDLSHYLLEEPFDFADVAKVIKSDDLEKSKIYDIDMKFREQLGSFSVNKSSPYCRLRKSSINSKKTRPFETSKLPSVLRREPAMSSLSKDPVCLRPTEQAGKSTFRRINASFKTRLHPKLVNVKP